MKKCYLFIFIFSPVITLAQWNFVGPDNGISNGWTTQNNIDINVETGLPVIVYTDNYKAICLKFNGLQWDTVSYSSFKSLPVGNIIDFKIDKKNNYYLWFNDEENYQISCIRYDGISWK